MKLAPVFKKILLESFIINDDFIEQIAGWKFLGFGDDRDNIAKDFKKFNIPSKFKTCPKVLYRTVLSDKDISSFVPFKGISSWSISEEWALEYSDIVTNLEDPIYLLEIQPIKNNVILNIPELFKDIRFQKAAIDYKKLNPESEGIPDDFIDYEQEVVYNYTGTEIIKVYQI